jgi:hypothetical protein
MGKLSDNYRGYEIIAERFFDYSGNTVVIWSLWFQGGHILSDRNTIDGVRLTDVRQAINDAKKNVDTFYRLKIEDK